jgi:hypothetical protein
MWQDQHNGGKVLQERFIAGKLKKMKSLGTEHGKGRRFKVRVNQIP